uniref:Sensor histidine kinase n=1 Tax=uncultured Bacillota bacterium TaxID=344338 RepID=A0A650EPU6_9FIRM|nr:sensor histidine kinase [uncultured Firmicutes bacterium]
MPNKFTWNLSIRTKLLLSYLIIIAICLSFFGTIVWKTASNSLREESRATVLQTVNLAYETLTAHMVDVEDILLALQADQVILNTLQYPAANIIDDIETLESELLSVDIFRKKVSSIKLYLLDRGDFPSNDDSIILTDEKIKNEPWYIETVKNDGTFCWNVFHASGSTGIVTASRLVLDTQTHQPIAVLRADIDLLQFAGKLEQIKLGKQGTLFLAADNHIVNLSGSAYINRFVNAPGLSKIINNSTIDNGYTDIDNIEYLVSYRDLKHPSLKLVGAVQCTELDDSSTFVGQAIVFTALISLLLSLLILSFILQNITAPLHRLANTMENFTDNLNLRMEIPSNDIIGKLYKSFNTMMSTISNLIEDVNTLFQKQKVSELKALQAQINPHFLYNTLDSINWMAKKYGAKDISKLATSLGSFFRHSLNKGQEYTTISNELQQIISYVYIQKVRFKDKFDLNIHVDEEILDYSIIKLSLQPLVENCIVHAFEEIDYKGVIDVDGYRDGNYIFLQVSDNGVGANTDELNKAVNKSFNINEPIEKYGLHNVNERIKLYFNDNCGLSFSANESGGITVTIKIEVKEL